MPLTYDQPTIATLAERAEKLSQAGAIYSKIAEDCKAAGMETIVTVWSSQTEDELDAILDLAVAAVPMIAMQLEAHKADRVNPFVKKIKRSLQTQEYKKRKKGKEPHREVEQRSGKKAK